jgi:hypothetical protein
MVRVLLDFPITNGAFVAKYPIIITPPDKVGHIKIIRFLDEKGEPLPADLCHEIERRQQHKLIKIYNKALGYGTKEED